MVSLQEKSQCVFGFTKANHLLQFEDISCKHLEDIFLIEEASIGGIRTLRKEAVYTTRNAVDARTLY
jgi:hypothetical protein